MLRQQIERGLPPLTPRAAPAERPPPAPSMKPLAGELTVREFRFAGNTLIGTEVLRAALAGWLDRPLNFTQLQEAAAAVGTVYRDAGWVVRAYLPQQEIVGGIVTIQIVEAMFGGVHIEAEKLERIVPERLKAVVDSVQSQGKPLNAEALDRSLMLLTDLPGVNVAGSLREGARQGESEVVLKATDKALLSGEASLDNTGSRSTGKARVTTNAVLNSPLGFADQGNINFLHTEGSDYVRLAYSIPLGYNGWRVGVNVSEMRYRLIGPDFAALNGFGDSGTLGMDLNYPIYRSRLANLYLNSTFDKKTFDNSSGGATTTRYELYVATVTMNGNLTDNLGGGGTSSAGLTLACGSVDLDDSPNRAADAATSRTDGKFAKLRISASRLQTLTEHLAFNGNLTGQMASKNLDSGEKFYLGGSGGIRAYPASEGGGSEGLMLNLELRWRVIEGVTLTGIYDWGSVKVNRNNDFVGKATVNRIILRGGGLALGWQGERGENVKLVWARRIGSNPNPTATGNDQDGTLFRNRFWLNAGLSF